MARDLERERQTRWQVAGSRRFLWLLPLAVLVTVGVIGSRWLAETPENRSLTNVGATGSLRDDARLEPSEPGAVTGTTGNFGSPADGTQGDSEGRGGATTAPAGAGALSTTTAPADEDRAQETAATQPLGLILEQDPLELVGQQVEVQVPASQASGEVAFWIGAPGDRLLVVLERDNRDAETRNAGLPSSHGIARVEGGDTATISGTIKRVPRREERYSWHLSQPEVDELESQGVYLSAQAVRTESAAAAR